MSALIGFFANRMGLYMTLAALLVGFAGGVWITKTVYTAGEVAEVKAIAAIKDEGFKLVIRTETKVQTRIREVEKAGETIIKEVPVYVTAETDRNFPVPNGFVRVHDTAASGGNLGSPAESDGQASDVKASEAAAVAADNYKTCLVWREQVIGWQAFWAGARQVCLGKKE